MSDKIIARSLIFISLIAVFDSISTYALSWLPGFSEINPIMKLVLSPENPVLFYITRLVPTSFLVFVIWLFRTNRIVPYGIVILFITHATLMFWHFYVWFIILKNQNTCIPF